MSEPRKLRCYQYVNRPYEQVCALLRHQPLELLKRATTSAAKRAGALAANLHVVIGGFEVGVDVRPHLQRIREEQSVAGLSPVTILEIGWEASRVPGLFPSMHLELSAWPLSPTETQLEIAGEYRPPFGVVGNAMDAAIGHRIAEATIHTFLVEVVEQVKRDFAGECADGRESMSKREKEPALRSGHHTGEASAIAGEIAGAVLGSAAGPVGIVAGMVVGALAGTLVGRGLEADAARMRAHDEELDETIGVTSGDLGAVQPGAPVEAA